ncbi:hypothetical protein ACFOED_11890 [Vulcaniibacterium thermophilum]|uniref:Uncharacterized protein n=1 Tax=Vulcaniibacterium thermophilum TaxID=1169913 RepID=A0A918Z7W9_9GAMM|nr:hypothetical protein [Vulcaniibacterium thermophilum]GHE40238.1 hypothetical protein GCM10007167_22950 [Vulcaniibacterium thermophilum]
MGTIGRPPGGDAYPADRDDLDSYRRAHAALEQLRVPVLVRSDNPHERLFVAALDGTGNSLYDDKPENVGRDLSRHRMRRDLRRVEERLQPRSVAVSAHVPGSRLCGNDEVASRAAIPELRCCAAARRLRSMRSPIAKDDRDDRFPPEPLRLRPDGRLPRTDRMFRRHEQHRRDQPHRARAG